MRPTNVMLKLDYKDGTTEVCSWGSFLKNNIDDLDVLRAIWLVVTRLVDSATVGGGASPEVTVRRA